MTDIVDIVMQSSPPLNAVAEDTAHAIAGTTTAHTTFGTMSDLPPTALMEDPMPEASSSTPTIDWTLPTQLDADDPFDEPLHVLPIYLSTQLKKSLHLHQFPLHHQSLSVPTYAANRGKEITIRHKEFVGRVEIELPVDAGENVWRDERAEQLGFEKENSDDEEDGKKRGKEKSKKKKKKVWGEKVRLRSDEVPEMTGYYSGVIKDGALHIHPVTKVHQFRTSLAYIDDTDAREKAARKASGSSAALDPDVSEPDVEEVKPKKNAKQQTVLKEREGDGSGTLQDFRDKQYHMTQREDNDPWVSWKWAEGHTNVAVQSSYERLAVPQEKQIGLECATKGLHYMKRLAERHD